MNKMVNAMFVTSHPTGLGVYSREVLTRSTDFFNQNDFEVYLNETASELNLDVAHPNYVPNNKSLHPFKRSYYLNTLKPDFYYSFTHHGFQHRKATQIITIHDLIPLQFPKQYRLQYYYYKYVLPKTIKASRHIVTISNFTKRDLMAQYGIPEEKISVIYNGYEHLISKDESQINEDNRQRPYILMVGATFTHKNILMALKAFMKIKDQVDLGCVIVGRESSYMDSLKAFVKEKGLEDRVEFLGYVTDTELKGLYKNASLFLYPSLYEGFGLPILEAMHYSVPTIAANASCLPEVAGSASLLVNPHDENDMANAILQLEQDRSLREHYIEEGKKNLLRFSWNQTAQQVEEVIKRYS